MKMTMRKLALALAVLLVGWTLAACGSRAAETPESQEATNYVRIELKTGEKILIELYPEIAPITVKNFQDLVGKGFYNGLIFHRLEPGFVIQGGDPEGNGRGGPGYEIKGEFTANGVNNTLLHEKGVVSMARSQDYDSAGSQFFICVEAAPHLDGNYAAFGKVIEGMDQIDKIMSDYVAGKLTAYPTIERAYFVDYKA